MKLAIIGAGNVGGTLGKRWAQAGHEVIFGVRDPNSPKVQAALASIATPTGAYGVSEAVAQCEVVVLTTPWEGTQSALQSVGDFAGKVLIDVTNPIGLGAEGLQQGLVVGHTTSGGEQVAAWANGARVVKAFNTTGAPNMANPIYGETPVTMLFCGDEAEAKAVVARLGAELGFEMIDAGPLSNARLLEPFAMLWIDLAFGQGLGLDFAFKVLKR